MYLQFRSVKHIAASLPTRRYGREPSRSCWSRGKSQQRNRSRMPVRQGLEGKDFTRRRGIRRGYSRMGREDHGREVFRPQFREVAEEWRAFVQVRAPLFFFFRLFLISLSKPHSFTAFSYRVNCFLTIFC